MFPDFLCIGAQRSGTSWLYQNLKRHPEVWLPPVKEIHYFNDKEINPLPNLFDRLFDSSLGANRRWRITLKRQIKSNLSNPNFQDILWCTKYFFSSRHNEWYASLFTPSGNKMAGDITPAYSILNRTSVANIYKLMPNVKIIFIMRNPIQRAWSQAVKDIHDRGKTVSSVSETELIDHFNSEGSRLRGNYLQTLQTWKSYYSEEQFFIGFFEEIIECPEDLLLRIGNFLGIDSSVKYIDNSLIEKRVNPSTSKSESKISKDLAVRLAHTYHDEIEHLHTHFGRYTTAWLEYANKLTG